MNKMTRLFRHLTATRWQIAQCFPARSMRAIKEAIQVSEVNHMGELRFAVEAGLGLPQVFAGTTSRERALQVFSQLRVWDTEHNSGVLIYLLMADRKVEIVADRGIHTRVGESSWSAICRNMERKFRKGEFESGVLQGVAEITALLQQHFPAHPHNPNELPDQPSVL